MVMHFKIRPRAERGHGLTIDIFKAEISGMPMTVGYSIAQGRSLLCYTGFETTHNHLKYCYPKATLKHDKTLSAQQRDTLETAWRNNGLSRLDTYVEGTAFQTDVWKVLTTINLSEHLSYQEIATQLGRPKSARPVGNAVGANPISLFIPCHRVRHGSGKNTGYLWGIEKKEALLKAEVGF